MYKYILYMYTKFISICTSYMHVLESKAVAIQRTFYPSPYAPVFAFKEANAPAGPLGSWRARARAHCLSLSVAHRKPAWRGRLVGLPIGLKRLEYWSGETEGRDRKKDLEKQG